MKATVQYNDFVGTAAADISDHTSLDEFLATRGVDTEKYKAVGASFYAGYSDSFYASIVCLDNTKSTETKKHLVKISFEAEFSNAEFFDLFKRFEVVITQKHYGYEEQEVEEEIMIDDRKGNENS